MVSNCTWARRTSPGPARIALLICKKPSNAPRHSVTRAQGGNKECGPVAIRQASSGTAKLARRLVAARRPCARSAWMNLAIRHWTVESRLGVAADHDRVRDVVETSVTSPIGTPGRLLQLEQQEVGERGLASLRSGRKARPLSGRRYRERGRYPAGGWRGYPAGRGKGVPVQSKRDAELAVQATGGSAEVGG